jgi:hypothetical protein
MEQPKINFITFRRRVGNFNLLDPKEEQVQYYLQGIPKEVIEERDLTISFLIDPEYDGDFSPNEYTPLELLDELEWIYENRYIFNSRLSDVKKLREYLESIEEEQKKLRHEYEIAYAKYQIEYWKRRLNELMDE